MPPLTGPIKNIVVLMMENRSFDHMLGYFVPAQGSIDGLRGSETNPDMHDRPIQVSSTAGYRNDLDTDPAHGYLDVNEQIFGVRQADVSEYHATMQGFVRNYGRISAHPEDIMHCFDPQRLPMLGGLARGFTVCDRWFSSVPGPTLPNRAFAHGCTSQGRVDMSPAYPGLRTIYEMLQGRGISAKIYYYSLHSWTMALSFAPLMGEQFKYFGTFQNFKDDCENNTLANYCFIEPNFQTYDDGGTVFANDQHPDNDVRMGELFIREVYNAIAGNETLWNQTLLIIVYDEHGGIFDHVVPPPAPNPDRNNSDDPVFDFTRLGVRVPAVLVSPWIDPGVNHTVFEHASLAATAVSLLLGEDHTTAGNYLTERDRAANVIEITRKTPRLDPDLVTLPKPNIFNLSPAPDPQAMMNRPLTEYQRSLVQSAVATHTALGLGTPAMDHLPITQGEASKFFRATHDKIAASKATGPGADDGGEK